MADSVLVWAPGVRLLGPDGKTLAGGRIEFYHAGTTSPYTVYADADLTVALGTVVYLDSGGYPIASQSDSTKVHVYVGIEPYKVVIKDADGVTIVTADNVKGALDTDSILASLTTIAETDVETLTEGRTLTSDDLKTPLKNCNTTGGSFTVTLPDAVALSPGARLGIRMAGTANAVAIAAQGGQTISRGGVVGTTFSLSRLGETVWLVNDGGNWLVDSYVPPLFNTVGVITVAARMSTPPPSPAPGARYIIAGSPTGAWTSYAQHDIVEADGTGGWIRYTPAEDCGWIAYVASEDAYYFFVGTAWSQLTATDSVAGTIQIATRNEMQTGTATNRAVTPGRQHFHPAHPKAYGLITVSGGTPSLSKSYGVASVSDQGAGHYRVTLSNAMDGTSYAPIVTSFRWDNGTRQASSNVQIISATQFDILIGDADGSDAGNLVDASCTFAVFGDLAS